MPIRNDHLSAEVLGSDELLLVMHSQHRLSRKRNVSWNDLQNEQFVVISEMHCLGEQVMSICSQQSFQPNITCRSAQLSTVQMLVGLGQGVSILPAMARDADRSSRRTYKHISNANLARTIVAVRHRYRYETIQVKNFLTVARQVLSE